MQIDKTSSGLKVLSPAKINLFLEVIGKRNDGYHEIESVMQTISLFDTLYLQEAKEGISVATNCPELPTGRDNLVYRAAGLIKKEYDIKKGVRITLDKQIPIGGGLGGGSSNAAATLIGLNRLWKLGLSENELVFLSAKLGSDVPFFIYGKTSLVKGRGEIVFPLPVRQKFYYTLVSPSLAIPTRNIYKNLKSPLTKRLVNVNIIIKSLLKQRVNYKKIQMLLHNRLQTVALQLYPVLKNTYQAFHKISTQGVLLSGSGSTIFKLCGCRKEAQSLSTILSDKGLGKTFVVSSLNK